MEGLDIAQLESLQSKGQAELLDIVDKLRNRGVSRYISLPQLIVCGDQSSGKSSVLEAISGVPFPVNDGLCTRFATEVILRRAPEQTASVKVIPAADASPEHKEQSSLTHGEIPALISEAKVVISLTGNSTFSRDVLQLEISGPKLPHLTLVDLPGLIHHPNKEQTEDDVKIPKELVKSYIRKPRSIVLAIVTASNDTSNQIVLEFAKAADPDGSRTMGIITKPDALLKGSPNESTFFSLASNQETYFKLGWHVLRNADYNQKKDPNSNRDEVEREFFSAAPWKHLPQKNVSVSALRVRLSDILLQQISAELPELVGEIEHQLDDCKATLSRLGPARDSSSSRRTYLTSLAEHFQSFVRTGTAGDYQDPFFKIEDDTFGRRLRAKLRDLEREFAEDMHSLGHTYEIVGEVEWNPFPSDGKPQKKTRQVLIEEMKVLLSQSRGCELPGTYIPLLIGEPFMEQSKKWKPMAMQFVFQAWRSVRRFLDDVLDHVADGSARQLRFRFIPLDLLQSNPNLSEQNPVLGLVYFTL